MRTSKLSPRLLSTLTQAIMFSVIGSACHAQGARTTHDLYESAYILGWNPNTSSWDSTYKINQSLDLNGRVLERVTSVRTSGWVLQSKEETYFSNNQDSSFLTQFTWNGNAWQPNTLQIDAKDSSGRQTFQAFCNWNGVTWDTSFGIKVSYHENGAGLIDSIYTSEYQSIPFQNWQLASLTAYHFDTTNLPDTAYYHDRVGNAWAPVAKWFDITWEYFPNFKARSFSAQNWNGTAFENDFQKFCEFGPHDLQRCTTTTWAGNAWQYDYRESHQWDVQGHYTVRKTENFINGNWSLNGHSLFTNTYSGSNLAEVIERVWIANQFDFFNYRKYVYASFVVDVPDPAHQSERRIEVYPNPVSNDRLMVEFQQGNGHIELLDLTGKLIFSQRLNANQGRDGLDLSMVPNGIYILKVLNANHSHQQLLQVAKN